MKVNCHALLCFLLMLICLVLCLCLILYQRAINLHGLVYLWGLIAYARILVEFLWIIKRLLLNLILKLPFYTMGYSIIFLLFWFSWKLWLHIQIYNFGTTVSANFECIVIIMILNKDDLIIQEFFGPFLWSIWFTPLVCMTPYLHLFSHQPKYILFHSKPDKATGVDGLMLIF